MHYDGDIFRPPSEADSILLQVTTGCSRNKCTFCRSFREKRFHIKSDDTIFTDIEFARQYCKRQRRVFLCDGDALIIPQKRLVNILKQIETQLPWVTRVGTYANAKSIKMKTSAELQDLKEHGLKIAYMGVETGDDLTLTQINKGVSAETAIAMGRKIRAAGIKLSITVILGIAGHERSEIHAQETGRVLSAIDPEFVGALSLMIVPGTPLYEDYKAGRFPCSIRRRVLRELRTMISHTNLSKGQFHANHASNYLPIKARLPKDKEATLQLIDAAIAGKIRLRPEHMRGL